MLPAHETAEALNLRTGAEYGQDLAAALIRAGKDLDQEQKRQMSKVVLREIAAAVEALRASGIPERQVGLFERACRQACRDELLRAVRDEPAKTGKAA